MTRYAKRIGYNASHAMKGIDHVCPCVQVAITSGPQKDRRSETYFPRALYTHVSTTVPRALYTHVSTTVPTS